MPLPTAAEMRDRTKTHSQVRELLAQIVENALSRENGNLLEESISNLRNYVNSSNDAQKLAFEQDIANLRNYVNSLTIEENREVLEALVDDLFNSLIASGAGQGGWLASLIADAGGDNQQLINDRVGNKWRSKNNGYQANDRVLLASGDIAKNLAPNNDKNPNIDMTGWENMSTKPLTMGAPSPAVNILKGVDAPTVIDYFHGYFWGVRSQKIERSLNGVDWEIYCNLSISTSILRLLPTEDGEVLALASSASLVHKSIGWKSGSPTWKTVLTNPYPGANNPILPWGIDGYGSKFIATHYGSGTSNWVNSRYVWISTDAGETWNVVYDTEQSYPGKSSESHVHAACYDKWADRFYFSEGHGEPGGIYYSDTNGATWNKVPNVPLAPAPTVMVPTDFGIVMGTDSEPNGAVLMPREKNPDGNNFQYLGPNLPYTNNRSGVLGFADRGMRDPDTGIVYLAFNSSFPDVPVVIFGVGAGGASIVLTEGFGGSNINRFSNVVVAKGKLLATHNVVGRVLADIPQYTTPARPYDTGNIMPLVRYTRQSALAIGNHAISDNLRTLAIGGRATGQDAIAIGFYGSEAIATNSLAIGNYTKSLANSVAIGYSAEAGANCMAVGYLAKATTNEAMAIGKSAQAIGVYSMAIGRNINIPVSAGYSTAIGSGAQTNNAYCTSLGYLSSAEGDRSTSVGAQSSSTGGASVAVGYSAISAADSVSIGQAAQSGNYSVSVGKASKSGNNCVSIGQAASAQLQWSVAVGESASAGSALDVVIGRSAKSLGSVNPQLVIGANASSDVAGGVALGPNAKVLSGHTNSIAIGSATETSRSGTLAIGVRDIESTKNGGRVILKSPNGTVFAISVNDAGTLTVTPL